MTFLGLNWSLTCSKIYVYVLIFGLIVFFKLLSFSLQGFEPGVAQMKVF